MGARLLLIPVLLSAAVLSRAQQSREQPTSFPLESVVIEGSVIPQAVILELAGLRLGAPVDQAAIASACGRLNDTGLFQSVSYRYAPGPKRGFAVTLQVEDQETLADASIDIPGVDDGPVWRWLSERFGRFDRRIPPLEAGQRFLCREIERHIGASLRGQTLTVRMETEIGSGKMLLSFQPEALPRIRVVSFSGNQKVASTELAGVLNKLVENEPYTPRSFAARVEMNLRPLYEEHGLYSVRFLPAAELKDADVSLMVAVAEGEPYRLGYVEIVDAGLPTESMLKAAKLPTGGLANWAQIQKGLWEMERVVKRTGYFTAAISAARTFDDANHRLDLRCSVAKGPLYRFGAVSFKGLRGEVEARARSLWKPKPGEPYDYAYSADFLRTLSQAVDLAPYKIGENSTEQPGQVMDIELEFAPRPRK